MQFDNNTSGNSFRILSGPFCASKYTQCVLIIIIIIRKAQLPVAPFCEYNRYL